MISTKRLMTIFYIFLSIIIFECINKCNGMDDQHDKHNNHTNHNHDEHMNKTSGHDHGKDDMDHGKDGMDHGKDGMDHGKDGMDHGKDGMDHGKDGMDHGKDGMDHGKGGMDHMMMYFYAGVKVTILFKEWAVSTVGGLVGSVIGIFLFTILYEGLKYLREHLFKVHLSSIQFSTVAVTDQNGGTINQVHNITKHKMLSWSHSLQTVLHVIQMIMSYFLMLIFMTYNVWLCLAVVLGSGVGYFLFGWKKATVVDVTEHCH